MDFLKKFKSEGDVSNGNYLKQEPVDNIEEEEDVELSLGLSLNGRFGIDRRRLVTNNDDNNRLIRVNSVVNLPLVTETEDETTLTRTCSLPIAAEEWRKRKELQSLRRSEAKRKRDEKIKNGNCEMKKRKLVCGIGNELLPQLARLSSVGSPGSGGSSGVSDLENQPFSGLNKDIESKITVSQQSSLHQTSSSTPSRSNSIASEKSSAQKTINENHWKDETLKMMLSDMPCVSTKANGVDGKRIEGFLYRYRKGEEVRIVCVCHGSFLTPAEFVKHGGGGDVEHPLRHIVINPPSL